MCVSYAWIVVKSYFFVISDNFIIIFFQINALISVICPSTLPCLRFLISMLLLNIKSITTGPRVLWLSDSIKATKCHKRSAEHTWRRTSCRLQFIQSQ